MNNTLYVNDENYIIMAQHEKKTSQIKNKLKVE